MVVYDAAQEFFAFYLIALGGVFQPSHMVSLGFVVLSQYALSGSFLWAWEVGGGILVNTLR